MPNNFEQKILNYFNDVISKVDKYSNKFKIDNFDIKLVPNDTESFGINEAVQLKKTITRDLVITTSLNTGKVNKYIITIPFPVNNLFVINGVVRLNLNYLTNNNVVKITKNIIIIDNSSYIVVVPRSKNEESGIYVKEYLLDSNEITITKVNELSLIDRDPLIGKKLKILFDLDETPDKIDSNLLDKILSNYNLEMRDNICNKEFVTTIGMFLSHLNSSKWEITRTLQTRFYRNGDLAMYFVQNVVNKFYNLQSLTSVGIQVPNNINPITYNNMRSKVILSKGNDKGVSFSRMHESYTDFIDMVVTPDNANVNRINELTTAIKLTDEGTFIKCYDKDFNEVEVPFVDYISSRVLTSDQVDYNKHIINPSNPMIVKIGGVRKESLNKKYDYIELPSDERMSSSVKMIPMINHSDSVRASMGARMLNQSIEVVGCEKPKVSSGHEKVNSDLSVTSPENGKIISINNGVVILRTNKVDEYGDVINYTITKPHNLESMYGINISFNTRVRVGQVVQKGDLIFSPNSIDDDSNFNFGINCKMAMMNYKGYTYEDGLVVSESMARRFAHISIQDIELIVGPDTKIDGIMKPTGNIRLSSNDSLCDYQIRIDKLSKGLNKTRIEFLGDQYYYRKIQLAVPINIKEAYLVDAKFIIGDIPSNDDETIYQVEEVLGTNKYNVNLPFDYDYNNISLDDFEGDTSNFSYRIKFRLVIVNHLSVGDKITNRFGSKGVVSLIEKDEYLPKFSDGTPVDCVMNPAAVVSRKNLSQTMELYLTNFCDHIKRKCNEMINDNQYSLDDVRELLEKYKFNNYSTLSDEDLIDVIESDSIFQIVTGTFSNISVEEIIKWYEQEGMQIGDILYDGKTGRKIKNPVITGEMYLMKLFQLASKKAQVTVDASVKSKLVLGRGKKSVFGLKTGTMETDALFANNLTDYVKYIDGNDTNKSAWFLAHCISIGLGLQNEGDDDVS